LAGLAGLSFLLSAPPPAPPAEGASAVALQAQLDALATLPSGAPFELVAAPAEWAAWLNAQIADADRAPLAGVILMASYDQLWLEARLRYVTLFPIRLAAGIAALPAEPTAPLRCTRLLIGRLPAPAFLRAYVSARLNALWRQGWGDGQLERIEIEPQRIRLIGRRR